MSDARAATNEGLREAMAGAIYDAKMCDGDHLANILHMSDYIDDSLTIPEQLEQTRDICRLAVPGILAAIDAAGWQVVPKEPTGQMCWEGSVVEVKHLFDHDRSPHIGAKSSADVYRAMLAAAPRP